MVRASNQNNLRHYDNTKIKVEYELMIDLAHDGDYTVSNIDPYECYKYNTLQEAIAALYAIKVLIESEQAKDLWNIEGYKIFTTVKDGDSTITEDMTDNFYCFNNLVFEGKDLQLQNEIKKNRELEEELSLYRNYLKAFNIDRDTIKKHNEKLKREAI